MKKANSTEPAKYLPELAKISYDGITAKIEFDEHGDTKNGAITLYTVKDGKLVPMAMNVAGKTEKMGAPMAAPAMAPAGGTPAMAPAGGAPAMAPAAPSMDKMKSEMKDTGDKMKAAVENPKAVAPDTAKAMKEKAQ